MSGPIVSVILDRAARLPYSDRRHLIRELARGLILASMRPPTRGSTLPASTASGEDMLECIVSDVKSLLPEPVSAASTAALCAAEGAGNVAADQRGGNGSRHGPHARRVPVDTVA